MKRCCPTLIPRMAAKWRRQCGRTKHQCPGWSCSRNRGGHDWPGAWGNMDINAQLGGVGLLRPNLQHGASIERGDHGSAIGSGSSGNLGHFGTALSILGPGQLLIQRLSNGKVQKVVDFSIAIWFRSLDSITDYSSQLDPNGQFEILGKRPTSWTGNNNYYYDIQAGISNHASYGTTYQSAPGVKFHWNSEPRRGSFNAYTDQVVCDGLTT